MSMNAVRMQSRLQMSLVVVVCCIISVATGEKRTYRLVKHGARRNRPRRTQGNDPISFSGDLRPIIEAAEELAAQDNAEEHTASPTSSPPAPSPTNSDIGSGGESTLLGCKEADNTISYVNYNYAMETAPGYGIHDVLEELEEELNVFLTTSLAYCPSSRVRRRLQATDDVGIRGFDSLPKDEPNGTAFCTNARDLEDSSICTYVEGNTKVWYKLNSDADDIVYQVRTGIKAFLNAANSTLVDGLAGATYLGPNVDDPSGVSGGDDALGDGGIAAASADNNLSTGSIVLMSLASFGFIGVVGLITYFRLRKRRGEDDVPYVATLENQSNDPDSSVEDESQAMSTMLPSSYRMDSPWNSVAGRSTAVASFGSMGTIHESDDSSDTGSSGILVSEGYTTEDSSVEFPYNFDSPYVASAPVLGARPRTEDELEDIYQHP